MRQGMEKVALRVTDGVRIFPDQDDVGACVHGEVHNLFPDARSHGLMQLSDVTIHHLHRCEEVSPRSCSLLDTLSETELVFVGLFCGADHRVVRGTKDVVGEKTLEERTDDMWQTGNQRVSFRVAGTHVRHVARCRVFRK